MVALIVVLAGLLIMALFLYYRADQDALDEKLRADVLEAERDAARHEANEYRADAADLQKLLDAERKKTGAADDDADRLLNENTQIRADLHALAHKWK